MVSVRKDYKLSVIMQNPKAKLNTGSGCNSANDEIMLKIGSNSQVIGMSNQPKYWEQCNA